MSNGEYTVRTYNDIKSFYTAIPSDLFDGISNSPFQFKEWQELLYQEFMAQKKPGKYIGGILFLGEEPVLGGHFFKKATGRTKGLFLLGSGGDTDYNDLIWFKDTISTDSINFFINRMLEITDQDRIWISQVLKESHLSNWAVEYGANHIRSNPCAQIWLNDSYEEYWNSLKKSVRQNIRTAQNRIKTDNKTFEIIIMEDSYIPEEIIQKYHSIYENRRIKKNGKLGIKQSFYEFNRKRLKRKYDLSVEAMRHVHNFLSAYITIDGIIAGYFYGVKDKRGKVCLMHVAVDDEFSRYSPGMILLSKTIEMEIEKKSVACFDLTNGDEGYKFSLGAVPHSTEYYCYTRKGITHGE